MSKEKKEQIVSISRRYWPVLTLTAMAIALLLGGFLAPPTGQIDRSVLTASGEIFAFAALIVFIIRSEAGSDMTFKKGDIEVTISNDTFENEPTNNNNEEED